MPEKDKQNRTKKYNNWKEEILTFKMGWTETKKLEELRLQKTKNEKEYLTKKMMEVRRLVTSSEKFDKIINEGKETNLKNKIYNLM